jgi:hypothetical protein
MSVAYQNASGNLRRAGDVAEAPIHWPSAVVGLVLATMLVVGVSWLASRRQQAPIPVAPVVAGAEQAAAAPEAVAAPPVAEPASQPAAETAPAPQPTPIAQATPAPAGESARVANTNGRGVNLRAAAGERTARIKVVPEGTRLELLGPEQLADGIVWRNVREPGGATGWVSVSFISNGR